MTSFTYRCPDTGFRVQSFVSIQPSGGVYETVECVACGRVHLIDPATAEVVSTDKEQPAKVSD
jgi:hypothetical protein